MDSISSTAIRRLMVLFLVCTGLYFAKNFLMPMAIGGVIATLFLPFCRWMEHKKVPRVIAPLICMFVLLLVIAGITALVGWQISELNKDLDLLKQRTIQALISIQEFLLFRFGISVEKQTQIIGEQQPFVTEAIKSIAGSVTNIVTYSVLILMYLVFFLYYRSHMKQFLLKLAPQNRKEEMNTVINSVARVSQQYLLGLSKMIVCLWVMYGIGFSIIGVENAFFFAILCGLLEIVPFIGNITGTIITFLVAAVQGASPAMLAGIVVTYGLIQFIQGWVLEPLIVGSQVKINPLFTIIALIIGEALWGIPGIFLAIPLIAMFKIICDNVESLKPYGFLIGETTTKKNRLRFFSKWQND
ncbi:MAG: AI-2E family transporter [Taibaiella sp.]|nr:AI-2E family transporter [Taibaiella sp.]